MLSGDLQTYILGRECVAGHITVAVALGRLCRGNLGRIDFLVFIVSRSGDIPRTPAGTLALAGSLCPVLGLVTVRTDGRASPPGQETWCYRTDI